MFKSATVAIFDCLERFAQDGAGTTAIEYAVIASGVAVAIAATVAILGSRVTALFNSVAAAIN